MSWVRALGLGATIIMASAPVTVGWAEAPETIRLASAERVQDQVRGRGFLRCGVNGDGVPGFSSRDDAGGWQGFDVDYCRAIAAAVLGDANAVRFEPLSTRSRFDALTSGDVDVVLRNTSWTLSRDAAYGLDFPAVTYFDGQGFMVTRRLGVRSAFELDGARICVLADTTTERNLVDFFAANSMELDARLFANGKALVAAYMAAECDAVTGDLSYLAAERSRLRNSDAHVVLPDVISKEPLGPVVREGDPGWTDIVRWVHFALLAAEEYGVSSDNVVELRSSERPVLRRLLGVEETPADALGLEPGWAFEVIAQVGNYGELYARNLGPDTPIELNRGLNALWLEGGLHYAMPFR